MTQKIFSGAGGDIILPAHPLIHREDGGNLVVNPPVAVWERSELSAEQLVGWSFLVAAAGRAMLDVLPQLEGGCINYWEAGNWALNDLAAPQGPKEVVVHRRVHLHLLGRSRKSTNPLTPWGESPRFPDFIDSKDSGSKNLPLTVEECDAVVKRTKYLLANKYQA